MATILIVDDQATNRELLVTLLGYAGHRLLEAGSAPEGLAVAQAEHPGLIITDIVMPSMDGYEFARQVRAEPALSATQIMFYTATYEIAEVHRLAAACGVAHIMAKPSDPEVILHTVDLALNDVPRPVQPVEANFHEAHMRLLSDKLAAKVDELAGEVDERRRTQRALEASAAELRALFAAMDDVILVLDRQGTYLKIAPTNPRYLYKPAPELLGHRLHELYSQAQADFFLERIHQALDTGQPVSMEYSLKLRGETVWFDGVISPLGADSVFLVARDVSARHHAAEALRESEAHYRLLFEDNPMPMWVYEESSLKFLAVNEAAIEHYGYTRDEFLHMTLRDLQLPERLPQLAASLAARRGPVERLLGWPQRLKSGRVIEVDLVIHTIAFGEQPARLVLANDVTERRQAEAATQRQLKRLAGLRTVDMAISASLDLRLSLGILLDQVLTQLQVDAADVLLVRGLSRLEFAAGRGFRSQATLTGTQMLGRSYGGRVVQLRSRLNMPDLTQNEPDPQRAFQFAAEGFRAYFGVPLLAKGEVVGVLEVFQRAPLRADPEWLDYLEALAGQAAIAVDNARLFNDLQRSNQELSLAYDDTIAGWSRALDLRDHETEGHSQRVTELTLQLARELDVPEAEMVHLRRGALLHDIGKMGVPDHILLKAGPLSEDEWAIMRQHPAFAFEMLSPIQYLRPALEIPYCHHEKWDGSGYPRGLAGANIPLAARIFAVVDVWDALCSDRPYRPAWSAGRVRDYIQAQAGQHFDPRAVAAFEGLQRSRHA